MLTTTGQVIDEKLFALIAVLMNLENMFGLVPFQAIQVRRKPLFTPSLQHLTASTRVQPTMTQRVLLGGILKFDHTLE